MQFEPIQDEYWENRDSYSEFLDIYCEKCGTHIALYQKDGPGELRRMYVDRIHAPEDIKDNVSAQIDLTCKSCNRLIATRRTYEKEQRQAYFIFAYAIIIKKSTGAYPPLVRQIEIENN